MSYIFDFDWTLTQTSTSRWDMKIFTNNNFIKKVKDIIRHHTSITYNIRKKYETLLNTNKDSMDDIKKLEDMLLTEAGEMQIILQDIKTPLYIKKQRINDNKNLLIQQKNDIERNIESEISAEYKRLGDLKQLYYVSQCENDSGCITLDTDIPILCARYNIDIDAKVLQDNLIAEIFGGTNRFYKLKNMLDTLKEQNIKIHILSNNFSYIIWFILVSVGLHSYFETIICLPSVHNNNICKNNQIIKISETVYYMCKIHTKTKHEYISNLLTYSPNCVRNIVYIDDDDTYNKILTTKYQEPIYKFIKSNQGTTIDAPGGMSEDSMDDIIKAHMPKCSFANFKDVSHYIPVMQIPVAQGGSLSEYKINKKNFFQL